MSKQTSNDQRGAEEQGHVEERPSVDDQPFATRVPYEKPRVMSWSGEELEKSGTSLNACTSFFG